MQNEVENRAEAVEADTPVEGAEADGIVRDLGELPPGAIVEEEALARIFRRHRVSIKRAVERGELPPPTRMFGKPCWTAKAILEHISKRLEQAQREREKIKSKILKLST